MGLKIAGVRQNAERCFMYVHSKRCFVAEKEGWALRLGLRPNGVGDLWSAFFAGWDG